MVALALIVGDFHLAGSAKVVACRYVDVVAQQQVGTNGEMALWQGGKLTVCSTAAGPAFEGVGISMGMRGSDGAIDKVTLNGDKPVAHVIGDGSPVGICGSGLVDAAACMLDAEILEESGYILSLDIHF